jgi:alkylated DNA repair dioxygenase AlkB
LELRDVNDVIKTEVVNNNKIVNYNNKGWLLKDFLTRDEQIGVYKYTTKLSENSIEQKQMKDASDQHSFPLTYYNLVYTATSNCDYPAKLVDLGSKVWKTLQGNGDFTGKTKFVVNSVYAQAYKEPATMLIHKDKYCDWGISVSLGASCDFYFDGETIVLNSGDLFVADFSKYDHGVTKIHEELPGWFNDDSGCDVNTLGMHRMSIQIRDIDAHHFQRNDMMTIEEFKKMASKY